MPDESFSIPGVEQVPFVPASARIVKPDPKKAEMEDQLVTVGRPKEKKRKRDKTADAATAAVEVVDPKGKGREVERDEMDEDEREAEEVEASTALPPKAFNYSAVPNGLDQVVKKDPPNKLKKAKKAKKRAYLLTSLTRAVRLVELTSRCSVSACSCVVVRRFWASASVDGRDKKGKQEPNVQVVGSDGP